MANAFIRFFVRTRLTLSSRKKGCREAKLEMERTLACLRELDTSESGRSTHIPLMPGVDQDMQDWSLFQLLEHNVIVNRGITGLVETLSRHELPKQTIDPRRDVLPSEAPGPEQVDAFRQSVEDYLARVPTLGPLRGTPCFPHPLFGPFDAHKWHCMFGFHLLLHRRQAEVIVRKLRSNRKAGA